MTLLQQLIQDLLTGPFMNFLAQYGITKGNMLAPITIPEANPPTTITYYDTNNNLVDQIAQKLLSWISAGNVPPPPSSTDINQLYLIFPPTGTIFQPWNGQGDPIGQGAQAYHNAGIT